MSQAIVFRGFNSGSIRFFLPATTLVSVEPACEAIPIPRSSVLLLGLLSYRGRIAVVLDPSQVFAEETEAVPEKKNLIFQHGNQLFAIQVTEILATRLLLMPESLPEEAVSELPEGGHLCLPQYLSQLLESSATRAEAV